MVLYAYVINTLLHCMQHVLSQYCSFFSITLGLFTAFGMLISLYKAANR
jgi:hypothetical protein